jgi:hypothetical protein
MKRSQYFIFNYKENILPVKRRQIGQLPIVVRFYAAFIKVPKQSLGGK